MVEECKGVIDRSRACSSWQQPDETNVRIRDNYVEGLRLLARNSLAHLMSRGKMNDKGTNTSVLAIHHKTSEDKTDTREILDWCTGRHPSNPQNSSSNYSSFLR